MLGLSFSSILTMKDRFKMNKNKPSVPPPVLHTQLALVFYVSLDILVVSDAAITKKNKTKQIKIQNNH